MSKSKDEAALLLEAGHVCRYAGRYREAREIFGGVRALLPNREAPELALAALCVDERNHEAALAHCRRALAINRSCAAAYAQLAEIHLLRLEFAPARENLERARKLDPRGPVAELTAALGAFLTIAQPRPRPALARPAQVATAQPRPA